MKRSGTTGKWLGLAAAGLLGWGAAAWAGEEHAPPPGMGAEPPAAEAAPGETAPAVEAAPTPKKLSEMSLVELQSYQAFTYVSGGRDPLTFREITEKPKAEEKVAGAEPVKTTPAKVPTIEPPAADRQIEYLEERLLVVEMRLLAHDFDECLRICDEVEQTLKKDWGGAPTVDEAGRLWRQLRLYRQTARRLRQAHETEREFGEMGIKILGIRWTPRGASALINDKIYEPGEMLENLASRAQIQVEAVEENAVVFIYKGQRFRLVMSAEAITGR